MRKRVISGSVTSIVPDVRAAACQRSSTESALSMIPPRRTAIPLAALDRFLRGEMEHDLRAAGRRRESLAVGEVSMDDRERGGPVRDGAAQARRALGGAGEDAHLRAPFEKAADQPCSEPAGAAR